MPDLYVRGMSDHHAASHRLQSSAHAALRKLHSRTLVLDSVDTLRPFDITHVEMCAVLVLEALLDARNAGCDFVNGLLVEPNSDERKACKAWGDEQAYNPLIDQRVGNRIRAEWMLRVLAKHEGMPEIDRRDQHHFATSLRHLCERLVEAPAAADAIQVRRKRRSDQQKRQDECAILDCIESQPGITRDEISTATGIAAAHVSASRAWKAEASARAEAASKRRAARTGIGGVGDPTVDLHQMAYGIRDNERAPRQ